jgi:hypothetical protein
LKLYVGGSSASLTEVNTEGTASTFYYFGLPGNTTVTWSGNAAYLGILYAPEANLTLGGGGNQTMDYQGACLATSITLNGHFNFHFDENLTRAFYK